MGMNVTNVQMDARDVSITPTVLNVKVDTWDPIVKSIVPEVAETRFVRKKLAFVWKDVVRGSLQLEIAVMVANIRVLAV